MKCSVCAISAVQVYGVWCNQSREVYDGKCSPSKPRSVWLIVTLCKTIVLLEKDNVVMLTAFDINDLIICF